MKKIVFILIAVLIPAITSAQSGTVSGKVINVQGKGVANASVRELDHNKRVINHTEADANGIFTFKVRDKQHSIQVIAPGYRKITHKMLGHSRVNVTLQERRKSPLAGNEKIILRSDELFCGKYQNENVKQWAWIEQVNDTLFTLILPIRTHTLIDEYPQGRTLTLLSTFDHQLMQWSNVVDAYPVAGTPEEIKSTVLTQSYTGTDNTPGISTNVKDCFAYPHFQFSLKDLTFLANNPSKLQRLVADTYKVDNYWNFYPTEKTDKLLKELLKKVKR